MWALFEAGDREDPRMSTLVLVAERTTLSLDWLSSGRGSMLASHPQLRPERASDHEAIATILRAALPSLSDDAPPSTPSPTPKRRSIAPTARTPKKRAKKAASKPAAPGPARTKPRSTDDVAHAS